MIDIIHRLFLGLWQGLCRAVYHVRHFFRYLYTGKPYDSPFPPNATPFSATMCCYGCFAVLGPLAMLALSVGIMRAFLYPSFKKKNGLKHFFGAWHLPSSFLKLPCVFAGWFPDRTNIACLRCWHFAAVLPLLEPSL